MAFCLHLKEKYYFCPLKQRDKAKRYERIHFYILLLFLLLL